MEREREEAKEKGYNRKNISMSDREMEKREEKAADEQQGKM